MSSLVSQLLSAPMPVGALVDILMGFVMVIFVLASLLLITVILMQEGKGGGLAGAFGGAMGESFGVKAGTVNRFTAYVTAVFLGLALLYAGLSAWRGARPLAELPEAPAAPPTDAGSSVPGVGPAEGTKPEGGAVPPGGTVPPGETPPPGGTTPPGEKPPGETPPGEKPPETPPGPGGSEGGPR